MTEARCDCHDLLLADCERLNGAQNRALAELKDAKIRDENLIARYRAVRAAYPGTCGGCGERFGVGAAIGSRGDGPWRASCCLDDQGAPTR